MAVVRPEPESNTTLPENDSCVARAAILGRPKQAAVRILNQRGLWIRTGVAIERDERGQQALRRHPEHRAVPVSAAVGGRAVEVAVPALEESSSRITAVVRSEEHTSELQSL